MRAYEYLAKIDEIGGILQALKKGYIQKEIADTAYKYQRQMESRDRIVVGVNAQVMNEPSPINTLRIDDNTRLKQIERLRQVKKSRDRRKVELALSELHQSFQNPESNCIYPMLKAVKAYATLGEIVEVGRQVFGEWREPSLL